MFLTLLLPLILGSTNIYGDENLKMGDKKQQIKSFLKNISQVESSGGTNYNHQLIQKGIHKGHKAIGRYGLMPNTVVEVLNRMKMNGTLTPELQQLKGLDADTLKQTLETKPELEDQIAENLADRVLERQQDEDKAAYSWHQGHNLSPDRINQKKYQEHDYVKKYNEYKKGSMGDENE
jgi:hypothetical protein